MIVRTVDDVEGTDRDVWAPTWESRRMVVAADGVGFSVHDTVMYAGTDTAMWYRNHVEAVYCLEGTGTLYDVDNDRSYELGPGTMYVLDGHERHRVVADTDLRMACVFTPPCTGQETHDPDGSYPLLTVPPTTGDGDGGPAPADR